MFFPKLFQTLDTFRELFNHIRKQILNLDPAIRKEPKKLYIAYKTTTNFVDVIPQKSKLRLVLNMPFVAINDPKGLCRNVANLGRWGNSEVETNLESIDQIDDVMLLVKQSFDLHDDDL
jgi:predicted transport protein